MVTRTLINGEDGFIGLSADTKPTGYNNGMVFYEMDTDKKYRYDAQNSTWLCPEVDVASIRVKTAPSTVSYTAGQTFSATGMVIEATYSNGTAKEVTGYTYSPTTALATTDTKITISYGGKTCEQAITVTDPAPAGDA